VQTYDLFFRAVFLFFIIDHGSRRVMHVGVPRTPTDAWVAQQVREATPFGEAPRFLICDNNDKYGACFEHAVTGAGIELIHAPLYAPKANARCERFVGTVRHDCLDHVLILSDQHVRRVIHAYCQFFNQARPCIRGLTNKSRSQPTLSLYRNTNRVKSFPYRFWVAYTMTTDAA
jgi:putative transposase